MTADEVGSANIVLPENKGHAVSSSPWGYHATTVGGRKNKTKGYKNRNKNKKGGKTNKNKRRSKYTRQKQNKRTRKQKNKL